MTSPGLPKAPIGLSLGGAALVALASLGAGCEGAERPPPQAYCEVDTLSGRPIECCRLCMVAAGLEDRDCDLPVPPSQFRGISAIWQDWQGSCSAFTVSAGSCSNGMSFILWHDGLAGETRYFDEAGAFVALQTWVDVIDETCTGKWYWPKVVDCEPVASQILCTPSTELSSAIE